MRLGVYWRVWLACVRNCISRQLEFKFDFIATFSTELVFQASHIVMFLVVTEYTEIAGWSRPELIVLLGVCYLIDSLMMIFIFQNLINLPTQINKGELDFMLLKPVDAQYLISTRYVRPQNLLPMLTGLAMIAWGVIAMGSLPSLLSLLGFGALLASGMVMLYATFFMFQCMGFWLQASQGFEGGYFTFYEFILKPDSIYRGTLKFALTFVLPATLIGSLPARVILGKDADPLVMLWAIAVAVLLLVASRVVFRAGLRRYESASS